MAGSRVSTGKVKDKPGIFYCSRQKGNTQKMMGTCQKETEVNLKSIPIGQSGYYVNNKIMPVIGYESMTLH